MDLKEIKKKEKEKIKKYKNQLKSEIFELENEIDYAEDGSAIIACKVENLQELFSPYDIAQNRTFCNDFFDYLIDETSIIPLHNNLEIRIHSPYPFTEKEQAQIKRAMKNDYGFYITNDMVELKRMKRSFVTLCSLGILVLCLVALLNSWNTVFPIREMLTVFGWFLLWESTSLGIFGRRRLSKHRYNLLRLYNAKITFVCDNKKDI